MIAAKTFSSRSLMPLRMASNWSSVMSMSPANRMSERFLGRKSTLAPIDLIGR